MAKSLKSIPNADEATIDALTANGNALKAERQRLERDLEAIESRAAEDDAARELLANGVGALDNFTHQRETVQAKLRVVCRAIQLNQRDIDNLRADLSRRVTEARRPEYVGVVRDIKERIAALQSALAREAAFRDQLADAGGSMGNGIIQPMGMDAGMFDGWLNEAAKFFGV
jgi:type I site-specific restriction endonuclease